MCIKVFIAAFKFWNSLYAQQVWSSECKNYGTFLQVKYYTLIKILMMSYSVGEARNSISLSKKTKS